MLSFSCPKCGGTTKFDETKEIPTYCMFCGSHLPDMTDFVKEALRLKQDEIRLYHDRERHEMQMETMDSNIRYERARNIRSKAEIVKWSIAGIIVFIMAIYFIIVLSRRPF